MTSSAFVSEPIGRSARVCTADRACNLAAPVTRIRSEVIKANAAMLCIAWLVSELTSAKLCTKCCWASGRGTESKNGTSG